MRHLTNRFHDLLSRHLMLPVWRAQRHIRPSRRAVARAINEGLRFRRDAGSWSEGQKHQWMLARLRFSVRRAFRETSYYRELFKNIGFDPLVDFSFDDFAQLPVLERDDVREAGMRLVSAAIPRHQLTKDATGGSTGSPTEVWVGPEDMGWKESCGEFFMQRIGAPAGTRTALFWGHHLDPNGKSSWRERYHAFETNSRWFDCLRLSPQALERYHQDFERWRPACIVAYASAVGLLAEHILERGYRPAYPTRCFVTGAEKLLPQHRDAIRSAFGRPVYERYGSRDVGYMAFQTQPERSLDYEVDWPNIIIEPETNDRESSLLITKLHADGMPMIRYRVGDRGRFLPGSKPGSPALFLNEITGRDVDRIWLPDGRWITGLQIPHLMKDYPVREYMFVQRADYSIEIKIAPRTGFNSTAIESIVEKVRANLPGLEVTTLLVDKIPRTKANKWRPVVCEVDLSGGHPG
jgi:phenylacetate-CoA ligase